MDLPGSHRTPASEASPSTVSALPPGFAGQVLAARRARDLGIAEAARACGIDESVLRRAEEGEPLEPLAVAAIARGLGIEPVEAAPPSVEPEDDLHARSLAHMADLASRESGVLVVPDPAAMAAATGVDAATLAALRCAPGAVADLVRQTLTWIVVAAAAGFFLDGAAMLVLGFAGHGPHGPVLPAVALDCMATFTAAGWLLRIPALRDGGAGASARIAATNARRHALRGVGYVVSPRSLVVLTVGPGGVARREYLASSMVSLATHDVDGSHVTVVVMTLTGQVSLEWVPRSDALAGVVAGWRAGHATGQPTTTMLAPRED